MIRLLKFLYQWLIFFPLFLPLTILTALVTMVGCWLGGERIFAYYPGMIWSRITCWLALCPVHVKGREKLKKKQSYVFIANHQGAFDIFLIYGFLGYPIKWIMKKSLRSIPFVGAACESAGFIFVDNSSPKAAANTIAEAEKRLTKGASLMIFPEGSRTQDGRVHRFMKGAYQMALDLNLPIVPITLNGPYNVLKIGHFLINPYKLELIIHDPFPVDGLNHTDIPDMINATKTVIEESLWPQYRNVRNEAAPTK